VNLNKRWHDREQRWVAPGTLFPARQHAVDGLDKSVARRFVEAHHYSGSFPAWQYSAGLFQGTRLVGVAVFSVPMNQQVVPAYLGQPAANGTELGRFVCLPEVAYNGETWFLARAFRLLQQDRPELAGVVSYADPLERRAGALVVKLAHYGTIYQASNAVYCGRSYGRTLVLGPDGRVVSPRALSKVRKQERGAEYAARQLLAYGASHRRFGEAPAAWLTRVLVPPLFTRVRHPGNLAYAFGVTDAARATIHALHGPQLAYQKRVA
jgi:hypothetical protein